jgi:hypothetical protein
VVDNALDKQRLAERRLLAEDARAFFAALPWDSNMVRSMWRYLGPHWTTSSQQNDLLDVLSDRIAAQPDLSDRLQVKNLVLSAKIMEAAAQTADTYQMAQSFKWLRALGKDIMHRQKTVSTLHHLGKENPHWVALIIDGDNRTIRYGNSYGVEIPPRLFDACQWWLAQHGSIPFAVEMLPITT